jgi:hypothetical protein
MQSNRNPAAECALNARELRALWSLLSKLGLAHQAILRLLRKSNVTDEQMRSAEIG